MNASKDRTSRKMKTKIAVLNGKPDAGNPHVWFDEGAVASENPRRGSLFYTMRNCVIRNVLAVMAMVMPCIGVAVGVVVDTAPSAIDTYIPVSEESAVGEIDTTPLGLMILVR